mmetsp:Transcript_15107/g.22725  ORF Transcript_15107/g.22725 Transcript_15107/m.22725 type:complete len:406 (+) Transcript_15107:142-1359(+)
MLRAEQLALIQEANQQLLAIRQQEMNYYVTTFSSFGTQAALIAGFTLGALTGLDVEAFTVNEAWRAIFWLSTSISMAASIHCVLTTTFANIYGPNLALRGPSGSMVRAVKGMIAEKTAIFVSFIVSLIAFQCMTLATTWVVMKTYASSVCTAVLMVGAVYWYKYCLRIYNRFKFIEPDIEWRNSDGGSDVAKHSSSIDQNPMHGVQSDVGPETSMTTGERDRPDMEGTSGTVVSTAASSDKDKKKQSILSRMTSRMKQDSRAGSELSREPSMMSTASANVAIAPASNRIWMEGYLSKMGMSKSMLSSTEWSRRYFVLKATDMYYYKNREDFEADPSKSIKNRPISIIGYELSLLSVDGHPPHEFELKPEREEDDRRTWRFRCDTLDELTAWVSAFDSALRSVSNS